MCNISQIPVRELTSRASAFQLAAEVIQADMDAERDSDYRIGCCAAFSRLGEAVDRARTLGLIGWQERDEMKAHIYSAKMKFSELYQTDGARRTKNSVYWMGTRSDYGQQRRMTALLTAAKLG